MTIFERPAMDEPLELVGYLRLTLDRAGNKIGYDVQRDGIERWATAYGHTIRRWYTDKDLTAADLKIRRPDYENMLTDIQTGVEKPNVVVWRIDRLVRLSREFERVFGIIEDAGGCLIATQDNIDTRSDIGTLFARILVMLAQMEVTAMRIRSRGHQAYKAKTGRYSGGGRRPFGFAGVVKDDDGTILNSGQVGVAHVKEEIAVLREAARRVAWEGWSWAEILDDWHGRKPPIYGVTGAPWQITTLQKTLTSLRAVGLREYKDTDGDGKAVMRQCPAEWEPIVDEATWQRLRSLVQTKKRSGSKASYLLSGIVVCGRRSCGRREDPADAKSFRHRQLTGSKKQVTRADGSVESVRTYRCKSGPADHERGACGKLSVRADELEEFVIERVLARIAKHGVVAEVFAAAEDVDVLAEHRQTVAECESQLEELARRWGKGKELDRTEREIEVAREEIVARMSAARAAIHRARRPTVAQPPETDDRDVLRSWFDALTFAQRQAFLNLHIHRLAVLPTGRTGPRFDRKRIRLTLTGEK